jgi:hypothetical protein
MQERSREVKKEQRESNTSAKREPRESEERVK